MKVRHDREQLKGGEPPGGWQRVTILLIVALVSVVTIMVTHKPESVSVAVAPLLLVLGVALP